MLNPAQVFDDLARSLRETVVPGFDNDTMPQFPFSTGEAASTDHDPAIQGELSFPRDVDQSRPVDASDHLHPVEPDLQTDDVVDWASFLNFPDPQSHCEAPMSVYSESTLAATPRSMVSDDTAVDTPGSFSPQSAVMDNFEDDHQQLSYVAPVGPYGYHFGAYDEEAPSMVMYSPGPRYFTSTFGSLDSNPFAFPFRFNIDSCGQPQQQHLPGAVASFAPDGMSMPAGDRVALLTPTPMIGVPETPAEVAPEDTTTTAPASRKRAMSQNGEKPKKRRKQQSTEKTLQCPECGSLWARTNNLAVHIKSVHKGERPFACNAPGCTKAFSRKHDLTRHFQSDHTNEGSPRRKAPKV